MSAAPKDPREGARPDGAADGEERASLAVDIYGVKARLAGADGGEDPESWRAVAIGINRHLRRVAVDVFGAVADALATVRSAVQSVGNTFRGAGEIPGAVAKRIEHGRDRADEREGKRQEQLPALPNPAYEEGAFERLVLKLEYLRSKGIDAALVEVSPGRWAITLVRPGAGEAALVVASEALGGPTPAGSGTAVTLVTNGGAGLLVDLTREQDDAGLGLSAPDVDAGAATAPQQQQRQPPPTDQPPAG